MLRPYIPHPLPRHSCRIPYRFIQLYFCQAMEFAFNRPFGLMTPT
jgi:hypothetical protein